MNLDILKWLVPALTGLIQLAINTIANAQKAGEMTAAEAQAYRDKLDDILSKEYAKTDEQRGKAPAGKG
jgi:hypothetical protein